MLSLLWLVPILPLFGAALLGLLGKRIKGNIAGLIASGSILLAFVISCMLFAEVQHGVVATVNYFEWFKAGNLQVFFSLLIDPLSALMLLIITGVGFLIHLYSISYMHHDEGITRFFAYLNLFVFFMLILVLGSNYLLMFAGWEGVGLCSYLLIGFWFKNTSYNNAAKKAFIMNRIGDLGFLLGMFLIYQNFGSLDYNVVFAKAGAVAAGTPFITAITLLLFIGAMGKSAQLPLYTWLPDAMAGPTPVSALIHAATMVTAGLYMCVRSNVLYSLAPFSLEVIAIVGTLTALFAATIGLAQNDIKKVLAYSTVSQLGYMFAAIGVGAYTSAMFHVTTHAFFKALLFLGAGSVIHAMSGEQDLRNMGGLKKALPITYLTFFIGTLAISGVPPFAGFFSKDEILTKVYEHNLVLYIILLVSSLFTAFYMFRLLYLTFGGSFRGTEEQKHHVHESPKNITIPLIILAILSTVGGFIGIPEIFNAKHWLNEYMSPVVAIGQHHALSHTVEYTLMGITLAGIAIMIMAARNQYIKMGIVPSPEEAKLTHLHTLIYKKYYVDELYEKIFVKPLFWLAQKTYKIVECIFIDGIVNTSGWLVISTSNGLRYLQNGNIGFYVFAMVLGIISLLFFHFVI